jgi:hypothetical protein
MRNGDEAAWEANMRDTSRDESGAITSRSDTNEVRKPMSRNGRLLTAGAAAALLAISVGCSSAGEPSAGQADEDTAEEVASLGQVRQASQCLIGCPSGAYDYGYYCAHCGGSTCLYSYDSVNCYYPSNTPYSSYDTCATGPYGQVSQASCVGSYRAVSVHCDMACQGSPGAGCGWAGVNTTHCVYGSIPKLSAMQAYNNYQRGSAITYWGDKFTPSFNAVQFIQWNGYSWDDLGTLGSGTTYWWNGNKTQINAVVPTNLVPGRETRTRVVTADYGAASAWSNPFYPW